jgi:hypothetical protein
MAGYIGTKAVNLSTTGADIAGDADVSGDLTVDTSTLHVDSANNRVGIGTSLPSVDLHVSSTFPQIRLEDSDSAGYYSNIEQGNSAFTFDVDSGNVGSGSFRVKMGGSEAMRLDASGRLLHGKTTSSETVLGTKIELNSNGGRIIVTGSGGTGGALFLGNDTTGNVGLMRENGDFESKNNSYTGFSDVRLKENIEDSGSQWEDIKALRVCKFSFIQDQLDAPNKIGLIAQELEETGMSGLVSTNPDLSNPDETIKTVKYSILYMKAVKALQEAMERIETLEAEQTTIKARLDAQETP